MWKDEFQFDQSWMIIDQVSILGVRRDGCQGHGNKLIWTRAHLNSCYNNMLIHHRPHPLAPRMLGRSVTT